MIAATYTQGDSFRIEQIDVPEIAQDEILLRVQSASICGTDIRIVRNGHRKLEDGQKIILGHEFAGTIEQCGKDAGHFPVGMRVGIAPNTGCGQCEMCIRGLPNMCADYTAFGITYDGAHAEFVRIPAKVVQQGSVVPLPDSISWREAALIEPLSCVVNGMRASRLEIGDVALIFGAGPIGLMHLLLANRSGASRVIVIDVCEERLEAAKRLGAHVTLNPGRESIEEAVSFHTEGRGADVVITACSVASVQEQALHLLAPFGRLCLFGGLPKDSASVSFNSNLIHYKNLLVTGVTGGPPSDFRRAMRMIETHAIEITKTISDVKKIDSLEAAYRIAMNGNALKVVVEA